MLKELHKQLEADEKMLREATEAISALQRNREASLEVYDNLSKQLRELQV